MAETLQDISKRDAGLAHRIALGAISATSWQKYHDFQQRQSCIAAAQAKPLPGESLGAFLNGDIRVQDKLVHRIVPKHFVILAALESPLLKMMEQAVADKKSDMNWTDAQEWEVCYVFTQDKKELFAEFANGGADAIKKSAECVVGEEWDGAVVRFVTMAVIEQLKRHIETKVGIASKLEKDGEVSFFRELREKSGKPSA